MLKVVLKLYIVEKNKKIKNFLKNCPFFDSREHYLVEGESFKKTFQNFGFFICVDDIYLVEGEF